MELTTAELFELAFLPRTGKPPVSVTIQGVTLTREFKGEAQFITRSGVVSVEKTEDMYLIDAISDALRFK